MSKFLGLFATECLGPLYFIVELFLVGPAALLCLIYLSFTKFFWIPVIYAVWWFYDFQAPIRGNRRSRCVRSWRIWNLYRDYFPACLIKTADLDPSRNYIFGFHPHGILSFGAFLNLATEATGFSEKFPGIRPFLCTMKIQFLMPLHRELLMLTGARPVDRQSLEWVLKEGSKGNALCIVVGGGIEALSAMPGTFKLTLKDRKGFVRLALQHG